MNTATEHDLFAEWSDLNNVICDWRSRFDDLRDGFKTCKTKEEAEALLRREEYDRRYPKLPTWLI